MKLMFRSQVKFFSITSATMDHWAQKRVYFYEIDLRGRLFSQANLVARTEATCLKSIKFLNFFFNRIQPVGDFTSTRHFQALTEFSSQYPWVSPCGKELNFIKADDCPFVVKDVIQNDEGEFVALYGGDLTIPFDPSKVVLGDETQRLYLDCAKGLFLLRSDVAQSLLSHYSAETGCFSWNGGSYELCTRRLASKQHIANDPPDA